MNRYANRANSPIKRNNPYSVSVVVVGIIGHNGAGKSTLLKMLARISTLPTDHYPLMANFYHANHFTIFHGEMV